MNVCATYQKQVAVLTVVSGLLALACLVLLGIALADNPDAYEDPMQLLRMTNLNVPLVRWSMLTDLFGYYLLLLPCIYFLRPYLREQTHWVDLITYCGTVYVLIGAIGAVIMAEVVARCSRNTSPLHPRSRRISRRPIRPPYKKPTDSSW